MTKVASSCIPFVNTLADAKIAAQYYKDCAIVRLNLHSFDDLNARLPSACARWVDAGADGLSQTHLSDDHFEGFMAQFEGSDQISVAQTQPKAQDSTVTNFVNSILNACEAKDPSWISVPQLPYTNDSSRNKINKRLAAISKEWRTKTGSTARFILPVILTHQQQITTKTHRNPKVRLAADCYELAGADGYWVVDRTVQDFDGAPALEKRVSGLMSWQKELIHRIDRRVRVRVVGPYWGIGLVLWARGLADYLGVGLGSAYTYYLPGSHKSQAKKRVSLPGVYRLATINVGLIEWMKHAIVEMPNDSTRAEFTSTMERASSSYLVDDLKRKQQIAKFHRGWYDVIAQSPLSGRPLALYQCMSSAYVLGKALDRLPDSENVRKPESVAKLLMMHCL